MIQFYRTRDPYGFLSNYFVAPMEIDGLIWQTVEHYYQAQKFPNDSALREQIRTADDSHAAKKRAWQQEAIRDDWETFRDEAMRTALRAKFTQHIELHMALLATGETPLVEHTTRDAYWGDGGDGSGVNRMRDLLGELRAELAAAAQPSVNRALLDWLLERGHIELADSPFLRMPPPAHAIDWSRVEGMLLGIAIGDSLGNTSEANNPHDRRAKLGEIRDYLPNKYADMRAQWVCLRTTRSLPFARLPSLWQTGDLLPQSLAERFVGETDLWHRARPCAILLTPSTGIRRHGKCRAGERRQRGAHAHCTRACPLCERSQCQPVGRHGAGCHADPQRYGLTSPHALPSPPCCGTCWLWRSPPSRHGGVPALWRSSANWKSIQSTCPARPTCRNRTHTFSVWIDKLLGDPALDGMTTRAACDRWYSAAFLLETVPSALLILQRYAHDPEEAIVRAVNDTRDNDTIASIVGAAVGALHGTDALPARWRDGLLGRLSFDDDGALFTLIDEARRTLGITNFSTQRCKGSEERKGKARRAKKNKCVKMPFVLLCPSCFSFALFAPFAPLR